MATTDHVFSGLVYFRKFFLPFLYFYLVPGLLFFNREKMLLTVGVQ